ncbi:hypothetical protein ABPG75_010712 [Micractinium tetrahymenae]
MPLLHSVALVHSVASLWLLLAVNKRRGAADERRTAAVPLAPPLPGAAARRQVRMGGLLLLIFLLTQLKTDLSRLAEPRQLASMAAAAAAMLTPLLVLPAVAPRWWERHRGAIHGASRLVFFALPNARNPRAVSYVLQTATPQPGALGLLRDTWLLLLGSRTMALLMAPIFAPLPVLPSLLLSTFSMLRCANTEDMCSWPFLSHPLWQWRIAVARRQLEGAHLLLRALDPSGSALWEAAGTAVGSCSAHRARLDCRALVRFLQALLGVVVSTLLSAHAATPRQQLESPADGNVPTPGGLAASSRTPRLCQLARRCCSRLWGAADAAEAWLQRLQDVLSWRGCSWMAAAAAWVIVLSMIFVTALELEEAPLLRP